MKNQKVKNISYFCKAEFALQDTEKKELIILPEGAEVVSVNLEISKAHAGGAVSIGLDDEPTLFLNASATTKKAFFESSTKVSLKEQGVITAKVSGIADKLEGLKGIVRVMYFLPSEIMVEY